MTFKPERGRLRETEIDFLEVFPRLFDGDVLEAVDLFLLRFRARRHGGLGTEAVDELLQVGDLALLVFEERHLLLFAGVFLVEVVVVVARVFIERAALQLEDCRCRACSEIRDRGR